MHSIAILARVTGITVVVLINFRNGPSLLLIWFYLWLKRDRSAFVKLWA